MVLLASSTSCEKTFAGARPGARNDASGIFYHPELNEAQ